MASNMRIGGLASGMDIDQIVGDLMKAQRIPVDKLKQKKQILEWQRNDYRTMNTELLNFRTELTNMKLTTKFRARTVTSTNSDRVTATANSAASASSYSINQVDKLATAATRTNSAGISALSTNKIDPSKSLYSQNSKLDNTATAFSWTEGSVGSQSFAADGVQSTFQLSTKASEPIDIAKASQMTIKVNGKAYEIVTSAITTPATELSDTQVHLAADGKLTFKGPIAKDTSIKIDYITTQKVDSQTFTASTSEYQLTKSGISNNGFSLVLTPDGGTPTTYSLSGTADAEGYTQLSGSIGKINLETGKIIFSSAQAGNSKIDVTYKQQYSSFNITTQTSKGVVNENFLVEASESMNQVVNKVNASNAGVSMFYDSFSDRVSLTRTETGDFLAGTGNEIAAAGDFADKLLKFSGSTETGGENAVFTMNGIQTERNSNTFEMNGITFTLKQTFNDGNVSTLSVNNDSNQVYENIKAFVEKYNTLIDKIQKKTSEELYRSYKPLTDEQRESLSDSQQEQWEEKAKSGLLRRDPILTEALNNMRGNFYAPVINGQVSSLYNQLASIGIKTSANYLEGGKLEINEAELKKAIEADPTSVENLFRGTGNTSSEQGIIHRLYDSVNNTMEKLKERAGNSFSTNSTFLLGRQLNNVEKQIDRFEDRLVKVEDRYWRQFTAMEKAISKANSQSSYLMQQFSGGM